MIAFPNSPEKYKAMLKQLAEWHKNIQHADGAAERFVIINEGQVNPFVGIDLGELVTKQRSVLKYAAVPGVDRKLLMVGSEWISTLRKVGDRPHEMADMAFILLGKVSKNNWEERAEIMELAYSVGTEIMAWLTAFYRLNSHQGIIEDIDIDPVGPTTEDNLYGFRFEWVTKIYRGMGYDTDNFDGNEPERVIS
jgi:hypothetical protein